MNLQQLGAIALSRRIALGLNQTQLGALAGLSRTTIGLLEVGGLNDLGMTKAAHLMEVLGVRCKDYEVRPISQHAISNACNLINKKSTEKISSAELIAALVTGEISKNKIQCLKFFATELPSDLLVSSIEAIAFQKKIKPRKIWMNIKKWSVNFEWQCQLE